MQKKPLELYNDVAMEVRDVIVMAREGRHREGHLTFVIKALVYLKQFGIQIGKGEKEIKKIDKLIIEFQNQLTQDEESSEDSPLDELFEEDEDEENDDDLPSVR